MEIIALVLAFALGYGVSLVHKGITIIHKDPEVPTDEKGEPQYNRSLVDEMPEDVRTWYEQTGGWNK